MGVGRSATHRRRTSSRITLPPESASDLRPFDAVIERQYAAAATRTVFGKCKAVPRFVRPANNAYAASNALYIS